MYDYFLVRGESKGFPSENYWNQELAPVANRSQKAIRYHHLVFTRENSFACVPLDT
jgi:hypothetical protein